MTAHKHKITYEYTEVVWKDLAKTLSKSSSLLNREGYWHIVVKTYDKDLHEELLGMFAGTGHVEQTAKNGKRYVWQLARQRDVLLVLDSTLQYLAPDRQVKALIARNEIRKRIHGY